MRCKKLHNWRRYCLFRCVFNIFYWRIKIKQAKKEYAKEEQSDDPENQHSQISENSQDNNSNQSLISVPKKTKNNNTNNQYRFMQELTAMGFSEQMIAFIHEFYAPSVIKDGLAFVMDLDNCNHYRAALLVYLDEHSQG